MLCDLFDRFADCELLYDYMLCAHGCLDWSLTRYAWLFYVLLCYVCFYADMYACYAVGRKAICYGPEGDYIMGRKALY